ncbi:hypothetical protein HRM2_19480 [Desulforapulum autotrophicum HRM2]|uniref:Uncharacterized protein n=1 Tax=Desulforapulum autotrophicum (strain ATCC 43914 / DSM 3382 / VKM B-1955 / HRM2) TaxID=177437 RepID=C0QCH2_DESAH|nr:hypothetical protein HRM2_19480 [Desulforapulum autotrophicum HRM2]
MGGYCISNAKQPLNYYTGAIHTRWLIFEKVDQDVCHAESLFRILPVERTPIIW